MAYPHLVDPLPAYLSEVEVARVLATTRAWAEGKKLDQRPLTSIMLVLDTGDLVFGSGKHAGAEIQAKYPQRHMNFKERRLAIGALQLFVCLIAWIATWSI